MGQDRRYHIKFEDRATGDSLGLMLDEGHTLGYSRRLVNPFAAKSGEGTQRYRDLTEWTVWAQDDWRGGLGFDRATARDNAYMEAHGLDTRFKRQVILGPAPQEPAQGYDGFENLTDQVAQGWFGERAPEVCADLAGTAVGMGIQDGQGFGMRLEPSQQYLMGRNDFARINLIRVRLMATTHVDPGDTITCSVYSVDSDGQPDVLLDSETVTCATFAVLGNYEWVDFNFAPTVNVSDYDEWCFVITTSGFTVATAGSMEALYWRKANKPDSYSSGTGMEWSGGPIGYQDAGDFLFGVAWERIDLAMPFRTPSIGGTTDIDSVTVFGYWQMYSKLKLELCVDSAGEPGAVQRTCVFGYFGHKLADETSTDTRIVLSKGDTDDLVAYQWVRINGEHRQVDAIINSTTFDLLTALSAAPEEGDGILTSDPRLLGYGPYKFRFDTPYTGADDTKYWMVLTNIEDNLTLFKGLSCLGFDYRGTYTHGDPLYREEGGAWAAWPRASRHLSFKINAYELVDNVTHFAVYDGDLYAAAGTTVYEWLPASQIFNAVRTVAGATITSLESWAGYLWVAYGNDANAFKFDGTNWTDTGETITLFYGARGYLHVSGAGTDAHKVSYLTDPTGSATLLATVGASSDTPITGMAWLRDYLVVATSEALWACYAEGYPYVITRWRGQESERNGVGMTSWSKDGAVFIPLKYGLYRYDGDNVTPADPNLRDWGLPEDQQGIVKDLLPTTNWLYVVIDGLGEDLRSSILAYDGLDAWHEIFVSEPGERIQTIGWNGSAGPNELWFGLDDDCRYFKLPDRTDNPYRWNTHSEDELKFNPSGTLITGWVGSELIETIKDFHEVVILSRDLYEPRTSRETQIEVLYQIDNAERPDGSPLWRTLGSIDQGTRNILRFEPAAWGAKEIYPSGVSRGILFLHADESADDIEIGDCFTINGEVGQIVNIVGSMLLLNQPLEEFPETGDIIESSYPVGRVIRLAVKLYKSTAGQYATPVLDAILLRYQYNVLDRFVFDLQVAVDQGGHKMTGNVGMELDAADLRVALDKWAEKRTPFILHDPDGREFTVKPTMASEGHMTRKEQAGRTAYDSTYHLTLLEVT